MKRSSGQNWKKMLEKEGGVEEIEDMDIEQERATLPERIGKEPTDAAAGDLPAASE